MGREKKKESLQQSTGIRLLIALFPGIRTASKHPVDWAAMQLGSGGCYPPHAQAFAFLALPETWESNCAMNRCLCIHCSQSHHTGGLFSVISCCCICILCAMLQVSKTVLRERRWSCQELH